LLPVLLSSTYVLAWEPPLLQIIPLHSLPSLEVLSYFKPFSLKHPSPRFDMPQLLDALPTLQPAANSPIPLHFSNKFPTLQ
jgi:hypothetical protein